MAKDEKKYKRRVLAGSAGDCVHSLGVETFSEWMEDQDLGYVAIKLGPAVPIDDLINKIRESRPEVVAISYRLGDLHLDKIISEFIEKACRAWSRSEKHSHPVLFRRIENRSQSGQGHDRQGDQPDKFSRTEDRHFDLKRR